MAGARDSLRLSVDQVTARLDPGAFRFQTTDEIHTVEAVFGQERAVRSIEFALGMQQPGYNLFAAGPEGIGKSTIVESFLRSRASQMPAPPDWVYVHNFEEPDAPIAISLPAGRGRSFAEQVETTVESASNELRRAFESDSYARRRQEVAGQIEQERSDLLERLQGQARELGFLLQLTPQGINSAPLIDGKAITDEQFEQLTEQQREGFQQAGQQLEKIVQESMLQMRGVERSAQDRFRELDEGVASFAIGPMFDELLQEFGGNGKVEAFLRAVRADIQKERDRFREQEQQRPMVPGMVMPQQPAQPATRKYEVNAVICNDPEGGAPVIRERHTTYYNLIGRLEFQNQMGMLITDHTMIRAGALGNANGGFILLRLRDLLANAPTLEALKRALGTRELVIENMGEAFGLIPTGRLRPEPIPLDVKVVITGEPTLYSLLYRLDPDFRELFRVKADFDLEFVRDKENVEGLASYVQSRCAQEGLKCFSAGAVARLVEHSSRMVEDRTKLSANLGSFLDIVRQADYWAGVDGDTTVDARHVGRALEERTYRSALVRDRIAEAIADGDIYVETHGERVGQINALSVYDLGDISFGRPSRITCVTSAGRGTIVMIDRESDLSGPIHNKGFLILRGFLANRFGMNRAGSLHASLTFEQQYGQIDGDSASSTELYALLSSLAERPIDQRIAVTGSVDQLGRIQPIGGATAKIEGFFEICRERGLDGTQGVMVPKANIDNVVLRPEVADAVESGRFHVWAVETIEQGIEVLMGISAGERGDDGQFPDGTLYRLVEDRLEAFRQQLSQQPPQAGAPEAPPHIATPQPQPSMPPGIPPEPPPEPPVIV
ncbi:MAG: AAA family ATPase [Dehalococcoidia bacterium]|nr:AAA family ATPase [Dehalococcoidia bacterium]